MKAYIIFFGSLSAILSLQASTSITFNQDKPDRLYVQSYIISSDTGSSDIKNKNNDSNGNPAPDYTGVISYHDKKFTDTHTLNWSDGSPGSEQFYWYEIILWDISGGVGGTTRDTTYNTVWPACTWENLVDGVKTMTGYGSDDYNTNAGPPPIQKESCNIDVPLVDNSGQAFFPPFFYPFYLNPVFAKWTEEDHGSRHAQAKMKLQTGGKSSSRLRNVFGFTATATRRFPQKHPIFTSGFNIIPSIPVSQDKIKLGDIGVMPATGLKYKILPDNDEVDVTPIVDGADYYVFDATATKYHSYFDLYVEQATDGYSFIPYSDTNNVGHVFWQFNTSVPSDVMQYIPADLTKYLARYCGFFPSNGLFTLPGQMKFDSDNLPYNIHRRFYIGFPDLIDGLQYTKDITLHPPVYSLISFACVGAGRAAGFAADVYALPADSSPQNFGVKLIEMYAGPFDDETDTFYSGAPY